MTYYSYSTECDVPVFFGGIGKNWYRKKVPKEVWEKIGTGKKVSETIFDKLGTGKVSEPVSEKIGIGKKSRNRYG